MSNNLAGYHQPPCMPVSACQHGSHCKHKQKFCDLLDSFFGRALLPKNELEHSSVTTIRQRCSQRSSVQWTFAKVRDNSHARNSLVGHRCDCCWLMVGLSGLRLLGLCGLLHALPTLRVGQRRRYLLPHVSSMLQINDPTCTTT